MTAIRSTTGRSLRRAIRDRILELARRFGVYITRDPDALVYENHLRKLLSTFEINCVLDVGAYKGEFGRILRRIGYLGLIISFEPVIANFEVLEETRSEDSAWRAHRLALGSVPGQAQMRVFAGTTFHSFLPPSEYGLARFPDKLQQDRTETVQVERLDIILDDLTSDLQDPHIFLKVDTQGYDLEVIRGLGSRIADVSGLQIEIAVNPIYRDVTNSFVDALSYLQPRGFQVAGLFPVTFNSGNRVQVVEFDCIMCRAEKNGESA